MRRILLLLPINRIILSIRLWITDHIFHRQGNKKIIRTSIFIWAVAAAGLFAYPYLLPYIQQSQADYTQLGNYPARTIPVVLAVYILALVLIDTFLTKRITPTFRIVKNSVIALSLLIITYVLAGQFSIAHIVLYYLLVAGSEEALKYLGGMTLFEKRRFSTSDLLLFAFLTSLGFAFFENILYVIEVVDTQSSLIKQLTSGTWLLIVRGGIWFIVHLLFTGTIAYCTTYLLRQQKSLLYLFPAFLLGLLLHLSYNLLLHWNITAVVIIYVIGGYGLLSWLFYRADSLYIEKKSE